MKDIRQLGARLANSGSGKPQIQVDSSAIRELAELLGQTGLSEIEIEQGGRRIRVARAIASGFVINHPGAPAPSDAAGPPHGMVAPAPPPDTEGAVFSPMVGTAYIGPEPGRPPFVQIGDVVREGDTLLIVEAMKTMNPILAPRAGTIRQVCVRDGEPVEFGQTLMILSPENP